MTNLLSFFKIPEEKRSPFLAIWWPLFGTILLIVILTISICFLSPHIFEIKTSEDWPFEKQEQFVTMLIILSNILVAYNTYMFMGDADSTITSYVPNPGAPDALDLKRKNRIFKNCNILTFFLSGGIILLYVLKVLDLLNLSLEKLFAINEVGSVFIFGLFCVADLYMLSILKIAMSSSSGDENLKALNRFTLSAFPLIDLAGFAGVSIIGITTLLLHFHLHDHFVEGFAIGALAFHIIFTQINFAYLKTVELRDEVI